MGLFNRKPSVSISAVFRVAEAAGVVSFSDLLTKALKNGQVSEQQAAALRMKADLNEADANEELAAAIAQANADHASSMANVAETRTKAAQKDSEAKDVLSAVAEFNKAMGK